MRPDLINALAQKAIDRDKLDPKGYLKKKRRKLPKGFKLDARGLVDPGAREPRSRHAKHFTKGV